MADAIQRENGVLFSATRWPLRSRRCALVRFSCGGRCDRAKHPRSLRRLTRRHNDQAWSFCCERGAGGHAGDDSVSVLVSHLIALTKAVALGDYSSSALRATTATVGALIVAKAILAGRRGTPDQPAFFEPSGKSHSLEDTAVWRGGASFPIC